MNLADKIAENNWFGQVKLKKNVSATINNYKSISTNTYYFLRSS